MPVGPPPWSKIRRREHYGAAEDKEDSRTEGARPYAAIFYAEIQAMRGSAYRTERTGLVHAETLALARSEAARLRFTERIENGALPGTSHERLGYWVRVLGVDVLDTDTDHDVRLRCAAKYRLSQGPTRQAIEEACQSLLGRAFVRLWTQVGTDLATPPTQTYWPTANPGPASHDLGGGAWLSERAHLVVEVTQPADMTETEFLAMLNVHLYRLLDDTMPAWATFGWAINVAGGFLLDISKMDWTGITP